MNLESKPLTHMMKYFLSHPRSGDVMENIYNAHKIAETISYLNVVQPFKLIPQDGSISEPEAMKECIKLLLDCDAIILSGDYKHSVGCMLEWGVAKLTGKEIYEYNNGVLKNIRSNQ